jgi:hypothetical protein
VGRRKIKPLFVILFIVFMSGLVFISESQADDNPMDDDIDAQFYLSRIPQDELKKMIGLIPEMELEQAVISITPGILEEEIEGDARGRSDFRKFLRKVIQNQTLKAAGDLLYLRYLDFKRLEIQNHLKELKSKKMRAKGGEQASVQYQIQVLKQTKKQLSKTQQDALVSSYHSLVEISPDETEILKSCPDVLCVQQVQMTLIQKSEMGHALFSKMNRMVNWQDPFFISVLEVTDLNLKSQLEHSAPEMKLLGNVYSYWVALARGQISPLEMKRSVLGSFRLPKVTRARVRSNVKWLNQLVGRKTASLMDPSIHYSDQLPRKSYAHVYTLICSASLETGVIFGHGEEALGAQTHEGIPVLCRGEDGRRYQLRGVGFGPSLGITAGYSRIKILSPREISIEGVWTGLKMGLSLGVGFSGSPVPLIGKWGSLAFVSRVQVGLSIQPLVFSSMYLKPIDPDEED